MPTGTHEKPPTNTSNAKLRRSTLPACARRNAASPALSQRTPVPHSRRVPPLAPPPLIPPRAAKHQPIQREKVLREQHLIPLNNSWTPSLRSEITDAIAALSESSSASRHETWSTPTQSPKRRTKPSKNRHTSIKESTHQTYIYINPTQRIARHAYSLEKQIDAPHSLGYAATRTTTHLAAASLLGWRLNYCPLSLNH